MYKEEPTSSGLSGPKPEEYLVVYTKKYEKPMFKGVEVRAQLQGKHCKLKQLFSAEIKENYPVAFHPSEQMKSSQGEHSLQFLSLKKIK